MLRKLLINRYLLVTVLIIFILVVSLAVGTMMMDGENPLSMGMTIWHLNDSGRDILRVANETERYLLVHHEDWRERLAQNLASIEGVPGGPTAVWVLNQEEGNRLKFYQENGQNEVEVTYQDYLDKYIIISYFPSTK